MPDFTEEQVEKIVQARIDRMMKSKYPDYDELRALRDAPPSAPGETTPPRTAEEIAAQATVQLAALNKALAAYRTDELKRRLAFKNVAEDVGLRLAATIDPGDTFEPADLVDRVIKRYPNLKNSALRNSAPKLDSRFAGKSLDERIAAADAAGDQATAASLRIERLAR